MNVRLALSTASLAALLIASIALAQSAARTFELEGNRLKVPGQVVFKTGSAEIAKESAGVLEHVAAYLAEKTYISLLRVENHSDGTTDPAAQKLTEARALAVAKWLVGKGVDCKRLLPVGFGDNKPVADNSTPEGRAANRRTDFINAELRGRAIGGMPVDGGGVIAGDPCGK